MRFKILYFLLLACITSLYTQIEEHTYGGPENEFPGGLTQLANGDFLLCGSSSSFDQNDDSRAFIVKTDQHGEEIWRRAYDEFRSVVKVFEEANGSLTAIMIRAEGNFSINDDGAYIVALDAEGNLVSEIFVRNFDLRKAIRSSDGNFVLSGQTSFDSDGCAFTLKVSPSAEILWSDCRGRIENDYAWRLMEDDEGNYLTGGISYRPGPPTGSETILTKYSPEGNVIWESYLGPNDEHGYYASAMGQMNNGNYLIAQLDQTSTSQMDILFQEVSAVTGEVLDSEGLQRTGRAFVNGMVADGAGGFYTVGNRDMNTQGGFDLEMLHIDENLQIVEVANFGSLLNEFGREIALVSTDRLALFGNTNSFGQGGNDFYFILPDSEGNLVTNRLSGLVSFDTFENCVIDDGEQGLDRWIVAAEGDEGTTYAMTFSNGHYSLPLNVGNYEVSTLPPSDYWLPCFESVPINVDGTSEVIVDHPMQAEINCPELTTNITTFFLEECPNGIVRVNYANLGTAGVDSAWVDVVLDSLITVEDADIPGTQIDGQTYRYEVGGISVNESDWFQIYISFDCSVEDGQGLLLESQIFPDTLCGPDGDFSGAVLEVDANCTGEQVQLTISNIGNGPMAEPQNYIVIEDAVLREVAPVSLAADQQLLLDYEALGSTFTLSIPQEPGAPGSTLLTTVVEGCNSSPGGMSSRGYTNQFTLESDGSLATDLFYFPAADPMDFENGTAFPLGYGSDRAVSPGSSITYTLPFDFRASDTLTALMLSISPSPHLDLSTLRFVENSHPYQARIGRGNRLEIYFEDLPAHDPTQAGAGFISFSVSLRSGLPVGTQIVNMYDMQTDFNEIVELGESFHTVGSADLSVLVYDQEPEYAGSAQLEVFPNPFVHRVHFQWSSLPSKAAVRLDIFDTQGRIVDSQSVPYTEGGTLVWQRGQLPPGVYQFLLSQDQQRIQSGRLLAH
ncbi:MAG: T9SS type A sorting domain-containing protein [Bacteroidota bacterium]